MPVTIAIVAADEGIGDHGAALVCAIETGTENAE